MAPFPCARSIWLIATDSAFFLSSLSSTAMGEDVLKMGFWGLLGVTETPTGGAAPPREPL
jgi:hypothetical protein